MKEDKPLTANIVGLTEEQKDQLKNMEHFQIDGNVFIRRDKVLNIVNSFYEKKETTTFEINFDGKVLAQIEIKEGKIDILSAVNGEGRLIGSHKIKIKNL